MANSFRGFICSRNNSREEEFLSFSNVLYVGTSSFVGRLQKVNSFSLLWDYKAMVHKLLVKKKKRHKNGAIQTHGNTRQPYKVAWENRIMEIKPRRYSVGNNGHELVGISQKT